MEYINNTKYKILALLNGELVKVSPGVKVDSDSPVEGLDLVEPPKPPKPVKKNKEPNQVDAV